MPQRPIDGVIRFGAYVVEPRAGVLRKGEARIRLQEQPFQVLLVLLARPGEVVTREELHQMVWKGEALGDLHHRLNIAVNKIREALRDSAESPRYVETMPRRGYRFVAPVEGGAGPASFQATASPGVRRPPWLILLTSVLVVAPLIAALILARPRLPPAQMELRRLTNDSSAKYGPVLSDGAKLYYRTRPLAGFHILQIPVSGGEPASLPLDIPPGYSNALLDIAPNGQDLLVVVGGAAFAEVGSFWTLRISDGSSRRLGDLQGRMAKYSPDGQQLAFTSGGIRTPGSLWVAASDGSNPRRLLETKDLEIITPSWSRDGMRIAFGQRRRKTQEASAWEIGTDGMGLRRLVPSFKRNHLPAGWTPAGSLIFMSEGGQFWELRPRRFFEFQPPAPAPLLAGDVRFGIPIQIMSNGAFHAIGVTLLGQLQRFDRVSRSWEPLLGGISANGVEYSRDRQRVAYQTHPDGEIWVRRADGSQSIQLTRPPMQAGAPRWSPDDKMLAFSGRSAPDQAWSMYLVEAGGGRVRPACPKGCAASLDLAWMPDGRSIVYAAPVSQFYAEKHYLRLLDLATGVVTGFPGSEELHSPRMSPDGAMLAALSQDNRQLAVYLLAERVWKKIPLKGVGGWPSWSRDSSAVWYFDYQADVIMRCFVREGRLERMLPLLREEITGQPVGSWFSLTPNDEPMILRRRDVQEIYALQPKTH